MLMHTRTHTHREPEEEKEREEATDFAAAGAADNAFGSLPAPSGANDTWGDAPAAPVATPGFEAAGFEAAGAFACVPKKGVGECVPDGVVAAFLHANPPKLLHHSQWVADCRAVRLRYSCCALNFRWVVWVIQTGGAGAQLCTW